MLLTCHASVGLRMTPDCWRAELLRFEALRAVVGFELGTGPADCGRSQRDDWLCEITHHIDTNT